MSAAIRRGAALLGNLATERRPGSFRNNLFDHFVGTGEQRWRYFEAERLGGNCSAPSRDYILARSRRSPRRETAVSRFDDFVGANDKRLGESEIKCFRRFLTEHQLQSGRLFNRKIGWVCAFENFINVGHGAVYLIGEVRSVGQ